MKPILSIWINPKKTFEFLAERDPVKNNKMINILFAVIFISVGFTRLKDLRPIFEYNPIIGGVIAIVLFGILGILLLKFIYSIIIWGIGKIFQGKATKNEVQLVIAYSLTPHFISLAIGLVLIIPAIWTNNFDLIFYQHPITIYAIWIISLRNLVYGLSYFNKFSYGYGLLNALLPMGIAELLEQLIIFLKH